MEIADWRKKIDDADSRLLALLNERASYSCAIGMIKRERGMALYDPKREREIIARLSKKTTGPLSPQAVRRLFERIIDESRHAEKEAMVAEAASEKKANQAQEK